jgi:hypothetical protein
MPLSANVGWVVQHLGWVLIVVAVIRFMVAQSTFPASRDNDFWPFTKLLRLIENRDKIKLPFAPLILGGLLTWIGSQISFHNRPL